MPMIPVENKMPVKAVKSEEDIDLQQFWLILKRRWLPAGVVFSTAIALTAVGVLLQKPVYQSTGKLLIQADDTPTLTGVGASEIQDLDSLAQEGNPLKTEIQLILSKPVLEKAIDVLDLQNQEGEPLSATALKSQLDVSDVGGTDVIEVAYKSRNPQEAAAVVNQVMLFYIQNNVLTNRSKAVAARKFIETQLPESEANVRQAAIALRKFAEKNRIVDLKAEAQSAVEAIASLESQVSESEAQLANATARTQALRNQLGMNSQEAVAVSSLSQFSGVQETLKELQQVEGRLALEQTRYQEGHPVIADLQSKRAALKALLEQRVQTNLNSQQQVPNKNLQIGDVKQKLIESFVQSEVERLGLANQVTALSNTLNSYKQRSDVIPQLEQQQQELVRQLEAAQATYEILLKKLQEIQVAENQNIGNARIIETASVPGNPSVSKKVVFIVFGGVLIGVLLAAITVIVLETRDTSVKTVKEARDRFGYTLLATIPAFGKAGKNTSSTEELSHSQLPVRDTPRSPICEIYRMLQANLKFLSSDAEIRSILVTSSVPREGKSTVAANLAVAVAELGQRVLLVDADMRYPTQHKIWDVTNQVGLSNVIVNQAELKPAVQQVMPNLDLLTAGVIPPNPVALLNSKRMATISESFADIYDFVIIDAPPLVVAADALILGKMTDGVLLIARPGVVDSASAAASKESLERSGQNVLGLVVNGVVSQNEPDSYFYYTKEYYGVEVEAENRTPAKL